MDEDRGRPARQGECEAETVRSPLKCVALGHDTHITHSEVLKQGRGGLPGTPGMLTWTDV